MSSPGLAAVVRRNVVLSGVLVVLVLLDLASRDKSDTGTRFVVDILVVVIASS